MCDPETAPSCQICERCSGQPGRPHRGGIGGAIVSRLRSSGHRTAVIDRTGGIDCDLSSEQSTRDAAAEVISEYGRCDVLVHSAAAFDLADLTHLDSTLWRHVQAVNLESVLWLAQEFV